jgi:hypothetical protein
MNAAFLNGVSSHIFDFDDTHLKTIIHPAGRSSSAILALSEYHPVSGKDFLNALVLGVETECRIGNAVYPNHYDVGWHITGTAGVFGAAAAAGKLLGPERAADGLGAGPGRLAAGRPARIVRLDEQELQSRTRGQQRPVRGAARIEGLHQFGRHDRSQARMGQHHQHQAGLSPDHRGSRPALRSGAQHLQALRLRHRDPSRDRCGDPAAQRRTS